MEKYFLLRRMEKYFLPFELKQRRIFIFLSSEQLHLKAASYFAFC